MIATTKLYTPALLGLAVELANYPLTDDFPLRAEVRSPVCGSVMAIGLDTGAGGQIIAAGARVTACAVGQAAASLFAQHGTGCTRTQIAAAREEIATWLAGGDACPTWPGFALLGRARAYPARHGAILLAWDAALDAFAVHAG